MSDEKTYPGAGRFVPGKDTSLAEVAKAARDCHGCDLYERATQTVFGRGSSRASVVLIGEQPGDVEDRAGAAGDQALTGRGGSSDRPKTRCGPGSPVAIMGHAVDDQRRP